MSYTSTQKIEELKSKISAGLTPLIKSDYILLDCPYYTNVGDVLIWRGEQSFLSELPYRCLGQYSSVTFRDSVNIEPSTTILLQGGGNFGDLWRTHSEFRLRIIELFPDNKIVILPQTVWYEDEGVMLEDAAKFAQHKDLTICVRDQRSYQMCKEHFRNSTILLPDMAFYLNPAELSKWRRPQRDKILYLKRMDKELADQDMPAELLSPKVEVRDWPTIGRRSFRGNVLKAMVVSVVMLRQIKAPSFLVNGVCRMADRYAAGVFMHSMLKQGVGFVSSYEQVYSTRLHVAILAILLGKEYVMLDNSYGKNSGFKETWLVESEHKSDAL